MLIPVGPIAYLVVSMLIESSLISQDISLSEDSFVVVQVSRPGKPRIKRLNEILARPDTFFQDSIALVELHDEFYPGIKFDQDKYPLIALKNTIKNNIHITSPSKETVRIFYHGKDEWFGKTVVAYYSSRLVEKAKGGRKYTSKHSEMSSNWVGNIELLNDMKIEHHYKLWKPNRFYPIVWYSLGSAFAVLAFLVIIESVDPSFKSEREMARYLELPILGSLPKLSNISNVLDRKHSD